MLSLRPSSLLALLFSASAVTCVAADGGKVDFNYDIRPIISSKCYHCHGPDAASRKAKLRLDIRDEALKERDGVRAIVPGDIDASEAVVRILSNDEDEVMPPPKEGEPLTAREKDLLKRWIAQGAEYKEHWAWTKPQKGALPDFRSSISDLAKRDAKRGEELKQQQGALGAWAQNPIDSFVLDRLIQAGMTPSAEADPHTLCRRLYLDLTGLPPSPEELNRFVQAASANRKSAVDDLVNRLLASPHFGEKWARMWLDLARYADSTGYGSDKLRLNIWPYRDWVINAFNHNLPYDQFTIQQLAGDLLPNATPEQIVATAFHRNTMTNVEGGTIDEEYRVAAVKDRVSTTGQTWMGLTFGCAQCHTHKFDPISQKEYYQLFAVFNQTEDNDREDEAPTMPLPTAADREKTERINGEIATLEAKAKGSWAEFEAEQHTWEAEMAKPIDWKPLTPSEATSAGNVQLELKNDGSILASGANPESDTYTVKTKTRLRGITALRVEVLPDASLPANGPGRAANGNAVLSELRVTAATANGKPASAKYVRVEAPGADRMLSLAEVEIFAKDAKIRPGGKATQSSTDFGGDAARAIDGNTDGEYAKANSVTHTRREANPWWEVDLGAETTVDKLKLWNRTDGGLGSRLVPARVVLLDKDRQPIWEETITEAPKTAQELNVTGGRVIALRQPSADFSQQGSEVASAVDGIERTGWAFAPEFGKPHAAVFQTTKPIDFGDDEITLTFTLKQSFGQQHTLGAFRLFATTQAGSIRELPRSIRTILALEPSEREPAQREELATYFRPLSRTYAALQEQITKKRKELAAIKPVAIPVMRELAEKRHRKSYLLNKGNYLAPGEEVQPGFPAAFSASFKVEGTPDRLALAHWLVSPENPLTARVAVNRFWAQLFGTGIVETEEDFGTQGALPSHPELLDWLAVTFQSAANNDPANLGLGWDMKGLIKLIVTSATYRQSSKVDPANLEKDPRNRLLSHYPRRRLDAEGVRDQALALSGLLSRKIGGPSVYPPQPDGLWKVAFNGGQNGYPTSKGEDRYRRGLYTVWRRTMPYPSMNTFDAPSRESCTLRRLPTNTPLQAFVTLNDPCFVECAQVLARRIVREGGTDASNRIRWALQLTMCRPPTDVQVARLQELLDTEMAQYRNDVEAAKKLASSDTQPFPADADPAELAAWTVVTNVLLNLDGVLNKN